jgi:hypothetical protein
MIPCAILHHLSNIKPKIKHYLVVFLLDNLMQNISIDLKHQMLLRVECCVPSTYTSIGILNPGLYFELISTV